MMLAFGIACGLLEASRSGRGQVIDAAVSDGAALLMATTFGQWTNGTWKLQRQSNLLDGARPSTAPTAAPTEAGWRWGRSTGFYASLLSRMGLDVAAFQPQHDRSRWPAWSERFAEVFATRTRDQWCAPSWPWRRCLLLAGAGHGRGPVTSAPCQAADLRRRRRCHAAGASARFAHTDAEGAPAFGRDDRGDPLRLRVQRTGDRGAEQPGPGAARADRRGGWPTAAGQPAGPHSWVILPSATTLAERSILRAPPAGTAGGRKACTRCRRSRAASWIEQFHHLAAVGIDLVERRAVGVATGASNPNHDAYSTPLKPCSAMDGMSGADCSRVGAPPPAHAACRCACYHGGRATDVHVHLITQHGLDHRRRAVERQHHGAAMPVIDWNSSDAPGAGRCRSPNCRGQLARVARAVPLNSRASLALRPARTTMMLGGCHTGLQARNRAWSVSGRLRVQHPKAPFAALLVNSRVCPSGAARRSARPRSSPTRQPGSPPPPGCFHRSDRCLANARAYRSVGPPGDNRRAW